MALPIESTKPAPASALKILAKSFYKELRGSGYEERDVVALAGELLSLVTKDVKARRESDEGIAFLPKKLALGALSLREPRSQRNGFLRFHRSPTRLATRLTSYALACKRRRAALFSGTHH